MANDGFGENGLKYRFFKTWQPGRTIYPMSNHCEHVWLLGTQEIQSPPSKISVWAYPRISYTLMPSTLILCHRRSRPLPSSKNPVGLNPEFKLLQKTLYNNEFYV